MKSPVFLLLALMFLWTHPSPGSASSSPADMPFPDGKPSGEWMSLEDAWRQVTPTRERISLNGLWAFRPVLSPDELQIIPPAGTGWGYFKVPGSWPTEPNGMRFYLPSEILSRFNAADLNSAWYRREIEVPENWKARRIQLSADLIQSNGHVFVDGVKAGELHYPGGELDLTGKLLPGRRHSISILVSAAPEEQLEYMGHDRLVKLKSKLRNRGICGDLYLESLPEAAAISDVRIITSFRRKTIEFDTGFASPPHAGYRLEAEIFRDGKSVLKFQSPVFEPAGTRRSFGGKWEHPDLWDTDTPQNLYTATVRLFSSHGELLDEYLPCEFGFREFHIEGRDFYLNGKKIHLRSLVTGAPQESDLSSAARIDHMVKTARDFGANFLLGWNYSFAPGVFAYPSGFHKLTSERGMLTSLTLPHIKDFGNDLESPANAAGYLRQAEHLIRRFQNVPGVVMYVMNHNRLGYMGDQNPLRIGNGYRPDVFASLPARRQGMLAEKIAGSLDGSRPVYHHESGNFGGVCTLNCYLNWVPRQERGDWLEPWEKEGDMPVFFVEWGLPHVATWSSWRGPEFIWNSKVLQCLWVNEYNAAILGEDAYRFEEAKKTLYDLQEQKISGNRPVFFYELGANNVLSWVEDVRRVRAWFAERNLRDLRARGISGLLPWDQFQLWSWISPGDGNRDNPERFENLKQPGIVPDLLEARGEAINNPVARFRLNAAGEAVRENFQEFLCRIAGRAGDFTESGHNFRSGETVRKTLLLLNDSRREAEIAWDWSVPELKLAVRGVAAVPPGGRADIPVEFTLPPEASGKMELRAEFRLPSGAVRNDLFRLDLFASPTVTLQSKAGLYDPEGSAAPVLEKLGVSCLPVRNDRELDGVELLIVGRNGLKNFPFELSSRLESGLKLLLLEQDAEELRRIGLRCVEFGMRELFLPDGTKLHDWRGSSTMLPPWLETDDFETNYPLVNWNFFRRPRAWRAGNRGSLADVVAEKPPVGDWLPAASCGFDLQYAPMLYLTEGKSRIVLCQYAVSGRTESDPEAETILAEALTNLDRFTPVAKRQVAYSGTSEGAALLKALRVPFIPWNAGAASPENTLLVLGPGTPEKQLTAWVESGGKLLALGLGGDELNCVLPGVFQMEEGEHYSDYVAGLAGVPEFAGIGNAELHWRGRLRFAAFPAGSPGGKMLHLKKLGQGTVIAVQLPPWKYSESEFFHRTTRRRAAGLVSRMLANLDAPFQSGFFAMLNRSTAGRRSFELPNDRWRLLADPQSRGEREGWYKPDFRMNPNWRNVRVPGYIEEQFPELSGDNGRFWLRLEFTLPPGIAAHLDELFMGAINGDTHTWVNGVPAGSVVGGRNWRTRNHKIEKGVLKDGSNTITVLNLDTKHLGGIINLPLLRGSSGRNFYVDEAIADDDPYGYFRW